MNVMPYALASHAGTSAFFVGSAVPLGRRFVAVGTTDRLPRSRRSLQVVRKKGGMGVLTDLIVAPLAEADAVASTGIKERPWPWADVKGLGIEDLATIHCLIDGQDPNEPVTPPESRTNPFTKEKMVVTIFSRYASGFKVVAGEEEIGVFRTPPALVNVLAGLDAVRAAELAHRWSVAKSAERYGDGRPVPVFPEAVASAYLEHIVKMARAATEGNSELFVWMCP